MPKLQPAQRLELAYAVVMTAMALYAALATGHYGSAPPWYQLLPFTFAAFLLGTRAIRISDTIGSISVGFIFVLAAIIELGPVGGVAAAAASALGGTLLSSGRTWRVSPVAVLAALSNLVLAAAAAGWLYLRLDEMCADLGLNGGWLPAFMVIGVYYGVNSFGVALMASPEAERPALSIWSDNLSWSVLPFYFGGGVVMVLHLAAGAAGPYVWLGLIPVALATHIVLETRARAHVVAPLAEERAPTQ